MHWLDPFPHAAVTPVSRRQTAVLRGGTAGQWQQPNKDLQRYRTADSLAATHHHTADKAQAHMDVCHTMPQLISVHSAQQA
jgi:hypothetical protein